MRCWLPRGERLWAEWLLICVALVLLTISAYRGQWPWRLDLVLYDAALMLWQRAPSDDVVIVAIDEVSLAQIGRWPWPRRVQASLLDRIAAGGPRAVGVDVILSEPDAADGVLASAIARLPGSVLATARQDDGGTQRLALPAGPLAAAASRLGHVHVEIDPDAVVRSVYLLEGPKQADTPHFALALVTAADGRPRSLPGLRRPPGAPTSGLWQRDHWLRVPFSGPPGHLARISAADIVAGTTLADDWRGKIVLVGATASGLGDAYAVPTSASGRLMPGVEISAQVVDALQRGIDIRDLPQPAGLALTVLAVVTTLASYLWFRPRAALVFTFAMATTLLAFALLGPRLLQVWYPPSSALLTVILCHPLWSWRRLDASLAFMRDELTKLKAEPDLLPIRMQPQPAASSWVADVVERSIAAVRAANERTRVLRRFVLDSISLQADGVLVVDAKRQVVLCNSRAETLLGCDQRTFSGLGMRQAFSHLSPVDERFWPDLDAALSSQLPVVQLEARTATGRELLIGVTRYRGPEFTGHIINLTDVSALKAAARAREEAMSFLSHDLRAPQAAVLSALELRRTDPAALSEECLFEQIERSVRRTLGLAEAFVLLTRADYLEPANFRPVDLVDLCREMVDEAWPLARAKQIQCVCRIECEEAWVAGERALLGAAILNLVDNAIKYSPARSSVAVQLEGRLEREWTVRVQDQGVGIAIDDIPGLFERFRRLGAQTEKASTDGAGLGLVIVEIVARKHAGRVDVVSSLGAGSTFDLVLPRLDAKPVIVTEARRSGAG